MRTLFYNKASNPSSSIPVWDSLGQLVYSSVGTKIEFPLDVLTTYASLAIQIHPYPVTGGGYIQYFDQVAHLSIIDQFDNLLISSTSFYDFPLDVSWTTVEFPLGVLLSGEVTFKFSFDVSYSSISVGLDGGPYVTDQIVYVGESDSITFTEHSGESGELALDLYSFESHIVPEACVVWFLLFAMIFLGRRRCF